MKEYFGEGAKIYHQTKGKKYLLIPSLLRYIPYTKKGKLLDVACGRGDLYIYVKKKGYKYFGFDISSDMIKQAKDSNPAAQFLVASATDFSKKYKDKFDIVLVSMLLPAMGRFVSVVKNLRECVKVLKSNGSIIIGVTHPAFDHYMQSFLFKRTDVKTKFTGYYASGANFKVPQKFEDGELIFEDYHWTFADYVRALNMAGLKVAAIDECKPDAAAKIDKKYYHRHLVYPTYLVIVAKPDNNKTL